MPSIEMPTLTLKFRTGNKIVGYSYHSMPTTLKINYSESYDASTNKTTVTLTGVEAKSTANFGSTAFNGDGIYFSTNGSSWTQVQAFGHSNECSVSTSYSSISNISGGSLGGFTHNSSGGATLYVKCSFSANGIYSSSTNSVSGTNSCSLTTRLSKLTVYPNDGTWNGSSNNQSFSQVPTSTRTVADPTRTGWNFLKWIKGGGGSFNYTSKVFTYGGSNGTLTANWEHVPYTLTTEVLPLDAGTITSGDTLYYQDTKQLTTTANSIVGYNVIFSGWQLTGGSVNPNNTTTTTFTMGNGDATVTALFNKVPNTYTVVFNGNSATSGSTSSQTFTYDEAQNLTQNGFEKTDYSFIGWNTKSDNTGTTYTNGQSVINLISEDNGIFNLYAIWQSNNANIDYVANGHGAAPIGQVKEPNVDITLASFIDTTESYTEQYVITADVNGGFWNDNNHSNGNATRTANLTWRQIEWNTAQDGSGAAYGSSATYSSNDSVTLYAIWPSAEPLPEYNYTYNIPTGRPSQLQNATIIYDAGESGSTTIPSALTSRIKTFDGWYTESTGGTKRTSDSQVSDNEIVYAHYLDLPAFPSLTTPDDTECTRPYYRLIGWDTSSGASSVVYQPGAQFVPSGDMTLYAVWQKKGGKGIMYIGGEKYQIFIYNESSWDQYQAYIADGSQWLPY